MMLDTNNTLTTGIEAIQFRPDTKLQNALVVILQDYAANSIDAKTLIAEINKVVKEETNINSNFVIIESNYINAYALVYNTDINNPLFAAIKAEARDKAAAIFKDIHDAFSRKSNVGWVDLSKGRVYGLFSEVVCSFGITTSLLFTKAFSAEEKASKILHELGHMFTYFEMLGSVVSTNMALATISNALAKAPDIPRKVELLKSAKEALRIQGIDEKAVIEAKTDIEIVTILRDAKAKTIRSEHGVSPYDESYPEALADQFAVRHGAGRHLVTALDKMARMSSSSDYISSSGRVSLWVLEALTTVCLSVATAGIGTLFMLLIGYHANLAGGVYDENKDRFQRIRNDMVNQLKNKNLDATTRTTVLNDLKAIDAVIEQIKPFKSLWVKFFSFVYTKHRRDLAAKELQQDLERLATNNLFVKAAEFKAAL